MSNSKKTVLVVTGSRSDYGQMRSVLFELLKSKTLQLKVIATGMHTLKKYGNTLKYIRSDKMPLVSVVVVGEHDSMLQSLAKEIVGIEKYCVVRKPDLILVLGDRDEQFAAAIVAGHLGIPVAHLHGGDVTGYVVDEYIRHAITKFSHLHFPASKLSAKRVKLLGEEPWRVHMTGGSGLDEMRNLTFKSKKEIGKKFGLDPTQSWSLVLHHPTTLDPTPVQRQARGVFAAVAKLQGEKILCLPNSDTGSDDFLREIDKYRDKNSIHILDSIPRQEFLNLFKYSAVLIGNSSMGIIDSSFFKIPTVNVGNRQLGREHGINVVNCGYDEDEIRRSIRKAITPAFVRRAKRMKSPYGKGRAASHIVRVVERLIGRKDLFHKKLNYV